MRKEIIVHAERELTHIAILEDSRLAELYIENPQHERTIGNIYLGRIKKVMPSIKAAFVDVGLGQDAFLHYSDLTDNLPDWIDFLKDPNQTVGDRKPTTSRPKNRRRRPSKNRPQGRQGGGQKAEGEKGEGRLGKNAKARGQRRSQQRRRSGQRGGGQQKGKGGQRTQPDGPHPSTYLERDQSVLVKITKEPISNKGSRVSTDISLAGRFLVLVPLADYVAVSKKISSYKERRRLKALAKSLAPEGFGVIVRTVAEGKSVRMLDTDLRLLVEKWRRIERKIQNAKRPPALCYEDVSMVSSIMRDLFSEDYDRILVDDHKLFRNLQNYVNAIAPDMADAVQHYQGSQPIFQYAKVQRDFDEAFARRVDLPSGGYLFIEHTEAMHVVDVNSGRARHRGASQEENALRVNLESARAIARHLRLRDLGGIIVVDFIDLRDERKRRKVYDELKREFRKDRAVTKLLPMSDFGLIQITRQRIRPSITTTMDAPGEDEAAAHANGRSGSQNGSRNGSQGDSRSDSRGGSRSSGSDRGSDRGGDGNGRGSRDDGRRGSRQNDRSQRSERGAESAQAEPKPEPRTSRTPKELVDELDAWIGRFRAKKQRGPLHLHVHPFTAAYLTSRVPNQPTRWLMRHFTRVRVKPTPSLDPLGYRFVNPRSGEDLTRTYAQKLLDAAPAGATPQPEAKPGARSEPEAPAAEAPRAEADQKEAEAAADRSQRTQGRRRGQRSENERSGERSRGDRSRSDARGGSRGADSQQRRGERDAEQPESRSGGGSGTDETTGSDGREQSTSERSGGGRSRRRGRRGGRGRRRNPDAQRDEARSTEAQPDASARRSAQRDDADAGAKPSRSRGRTKPEVNGEESPEPKPAPSRRRGRGRSQSQEPEASDAPDTAASPEAQAERTPSEDASRTQEAEPKRPSRSRSRKPKTDDAPSETQGEASEARASADDSSDAEQAKPKRPSRSRSRAPKATDASAAPAAETGPGEAPAPKPRRSRSRKPEAGEQTDAREQTDTAPKPPKSVAAPKPRVSGDRRFMKIDLTSRPGTAASPEDASDA